MLSLILLFFTLVSFWQTHRYSTVCKYYRNFKHRYVHSTDPIAARLLTGVWGLFSVTSATVLTLGNAGLLPGFWFL